MNTTTTPTFTNKWAKRITVLTITFTIAFSGMFAMTPANAQAATTSTNKSVTASKSKVDQMIAYGAKYLGTPYQFGASTNQTKTFDCSSFTMHVFKNYGVKLNRTARDQAKQGTFVARKDLRKGDLVFFKIPSRPYDIGHVGIYVGNNTMLNASGSKGVTYSKLTGYWDKNYQTARRIAL
ncbi:C40 family peptidase [Paenibacillus sp. KN14-4R]|uniref:C40 family peptidase n=1 Tax=Paenibacillus sp. KN14-4R TaxID=3445773 RepID=UPI003F9FD098